MVKILENSARKAGNANRAKIFADIQNYHISPEQAADVAKQAGVGMLSFTHIVPSVPKYMESALTGDAADHFAGPIKVVHDGDIVSISGKAKFKTQNLLR
jgi:ribonuclease Z